MKVIQFLFFICLSQCTNSSFQNDNLFPIESEKGVAKNLLTLTSKYVDYTIKPDDSIREGQRQQVAFSLNSEQEIDEYLKKNIAPATHSEKIKKKSANFDWKNFRFLKNSSFSPDSMYVCKTNPNKVFDSFEIQLVNLDSEKKYNISKEFLSEGSFYFLSQDENCHFMETNILAAPYTPIKDPEQITGFNVERSGKMITIDIYPRSVFHNLDELSFKVVAANPVTRYPHMDKTKDCEFKVKTIEKVSLSCSLYDPENYYVTSVFLKSDDFHWQIDSFISPDISYVFSSHKIEGEAKNVAPFPQEFLRGSAKALVNFSMIKSDYDSKEAERYVLLSIDDLYKKSIADKTPSDNYFLDSYLYDYNLLTTVFNYKKDTKNYFHPFVVRLLKISSDLRKDGYVFKSQKRLGLGGRSSSRSSRRGSSGFDFLKSPSYKKSMARHKARQKALEEKLKREQEIKELRKSSSQVKEGGESKVGVKIFSRDRSVSLERKLIEDLGVKRMPEGIILIKSKGTVHLIEGYPGLVIKETKLKDPLGGNIEIAGQVSSTHSILQQMKGLNPDDFKGVYYKQDARGMTSVYYLRKKPDGDLTGSVFQEKFNKLDEKEKLSLLVNLTERFVKMHEFATHGNINSKNIFFKTDRKGELSLIVGGLDSARYLEDYDQLGRHVAPIKKSSLDDVKQGLSLDPKKSDVYSLGLLLKEVVGDKKLGKELEFILNKMTNPGHEHRINMKQVLKQMKQILVSK
jgi:hypothetical protein